MKKWTEKNNHLISNQILTYKDILIHQRKKLYHLRTRWRLERKSNLLPDIDSYFDNIIRNISDMENKINDYMQKYLVNFFEMQKLYEKSGETSNETFGLSSWMKYGERYGKKNNNKLKEILGKDHLIKNFNPFYVEEHKENFNFNTIEILTDLQNFIEQQYDTISLIEHCFNQRVQGSQIPVLDTRVTDVEKIGGNQIMYYAADSLVLDYLNNDNFFREKNAKLDNKWKGLTNFGYKPDFALQGQIMIAPGWSKYIHPESWILLSHECGHLNYGRYTDYEIEKGEKVVQSKKWFTWEDVPEKNSKFIKFLIKHFGKSFKTPSKIKKINGGMTIHVYEGKRTLLSITLNKDKSKAIAKTIYNDKMEFIAKIEEGKLNIYNKKIPPIAEIINDISETISPLFKTEEIPKIGEEIFSDIYAIFVGGINFLPPFIKLHFSPSHTLNNVPMMIPLRIEICKQVIKDLDLDEKYITNFLELLDLNNNINFLLANFELVKKYRQKMFLLNKSLKIIQALDTTRLDNKTLYSIWEELFKGSRNDFKEITDEIIGLDYFRDIGEDFSRRGIIKNIKNLIPYNFYESLELKEPLKPEGIEEVWRDNNVKEVILAAISYNLECENISYEKAAMLCDEDYKLSKDILNNFIEDLKKPETVKKFQYFGPLIMKKNVLKFAKILKENDDILIGIKPRHLISMLAQNDSMNYNMILFALSHNKNMRLRYKTS